MAPCIPSCLAKPAEEERQFFICPFISLAVSRLQPFFPIDSNYRSIPHLPPLYWWCISITSNIWETIFPIRHYDYIACSYEIIWHPQTRAESSLGLTREHPFCLYSADNPRDVQLNVCSHPAWKRVHAMNHHTSLNMLAFLDLFKTHFLNMYGFLNATSGAKYCYSIVLIDIDMSRKKIQLYLQWSFISCDLSYNLFIWRWI